jgi:small subunit ribosomal protein S5
VESAGIHDILTKCLGSANKYNAVYATIEALQSLRSAADFADARGKPVDEVVVDYPIGRFVAEGRKSTREGEASS